MRQKAGEEPGNEAKTQPHLGSLPVSSDTESDPSWGWLSLVPSPEGLGTRLGLAWIWGRDYDTSCRLYMYYVFPTADDAIPNKMLSYNRANRAVAILCNHQVLPQHTHTHTYTHTHAHTCTCTHTHTHYTYTHTLRMHIHTLSVPLPRHLTSR